MLFLFISHSQNVMMIITLPLFIPGALVNHNFATCKKEVARGVVGIPGDNMSWKGVEIFSIIFPIPIFQDPALIVFFGHVFPRNLFQIKLCCNFWWQEENTGFKPVANCQVQLVEINDPKQGDVRQVRTAILSNNILSLFFFTYFRTTLYKARLAIKRLCTLWSREMFITPQGFQHRSPSSYRVSSPGSQYRSEKWPLSEALHYNTCWDTSANTSWGMSILAQTIKLHYVLFLCLASCTEIITREHVGDYRSATKGLTLAYTLLHCPHYKLNEYTQNRKSPMQ